MKLIVAIIRPDRLNEVLEALYRTEVRGLTVLAVLGHGGETERVETYRGTTVKVDLQEKVRLEIGVSESFVQLTVNAILSSARTGEVGDGKIFVLDVAQVYRIRTGEKNEAAVTPAEWCRRVSGEAGQQPHPETEAQGSSQRVSEPRSRSLARSDEVSLRLPRLPVLPVLPVLPYIPTHAQATQRAAPSPRAFERAPNRAMLRAVGFSDERFRQADHRHRERATAPSRHAMPDSIVLARRAEIGRPRAGGMPQIFGTITVSDGISMGTEGMKYSLVSREVIADSIETACGAQSMDGVVAVGGCDKNMPGAMIAMARMNIPAIFVYGGTIKPGHYAGRDLTVVSAFEAVGQHSAGKIDDAELLEVERHACPGQGVLWRHVHGQYHVFGVRGDGDEPALLLARWLPKMARRRRARRRSAAVLVEAVRRRPPAHARSSPERLSRTASRWYGHRRLDQCGAAPARDRPTRPAWRSTLDDFEAIRARVPVLCDLKPSGRFVATDLHRAGGVPQVMKMLLRPRPPARRRPHHHRETVAEISARRALGAAAGSGSDSAMGSAALPPGAPGHSARQPCARGFGREDHRG